MALYTIDVFTGNSVTELVTKQAIAGILEKSMPEIRWDESKRFTGTIRLTTDASKNQYVSICSLPGVQSIRPVQ